MLLIWTSLEYEFVLNPLPQDKFLDLSKLKKKKIADDNVDVARMAKLVFSREGNI